MKYLCLGYMAEKKWEEMSPDERNTFVEECLAYDEILRQNGHMVGGEALQSVRTATTLRFKQGKLSITDGPFAETNEQLGGDYGSRSQGPHPCDPTDVTASVDSHGRDV
jgi:hypothetical protein